tara:strand:+ start:796 stop:1467 length:672 start_codon:yes stop_codon:yes gene_type:complete
MKFLNKLITFFWRDYKIFISNINGLFTILLFFFVSIFIFVFAIGANKETLTSIGVGILWSLLLLSTTLSLKNYYQADFENGSLIVMHMSGLSYELIAIMRIISQFVFIQIPFLFSIPIASILINLSINKILIFLLSFFIGSFILCCLASISASMNLLNNRNFSLGSVIVLIFSLPVIIFGVEIIKSENNFIFILNILLGILFIFVAISPWISSICIRLAIENK